VATVGWEVEEEEEEEVSRRKMREKKMRRVGDRSGECNR
jgi:hypothetical protein